MLSINTKKGFTLIELVCGMVVAAVVAMGAGQILTMNAAIIKKAITVSEANVMLQYAMSHISSNISQSAWASVENMNNRSTIIITLYSHAYPVLRKYEFSKINSSITFSATDTQGITKKEILVTNIDLGDIAGVESTAWGQDTTMAKKRYKSVKVCFWPKMGTSSLKNTDPNKKGIAYQERIISCRENIDLVYVDNSKTVSDRVGTKSCPYDLLNKNNTRTATKVMVVTSSPASILSSYGSLYLAKGVTALDAICFGDFHSVGTSVCPVNISSIKMSSAKYNFINVCHTNISGDNYAVYKIEIYGGQKDGPYTVGPWYPDILLIDSKINRNLKISRGKSVILKRNDLYGTQSGQYTRSTVEGFYNLDVLNNTFNNDGLVIKGGVNNSVVNVGNNDFNGHTLSNLDGVLDVRYPNLTADLNFVVNIYNNDFNDVISALYVIGGKVNVCNNRFTQGSVSFGSSVGPGMHLSMLSLYGSDINCINNEIIGNIANRYEVGGIHIRGRASGTVLVQGNFVNNTQLDCLNVSSVNSCEIMNNVFAKTLYSAAYGINIENYTNAIVVTNNILYSNAGIKSNVYNGNVNLRHITILDGALSASSSFCNSTKNCIFSDNVNVPKSNVSYSRVKDISGYTTPGMIADTPYFVNDSMRDYRLRTDTNANDRLKTGGENGIEMGAFGGDGASGWANGVGCQGTVGNT